MVMRINKKSVTRIEISDLEGLDNIGLILEDVRSGQGRLTITCFDQAWVCSWSAMGNRSIAEFVHAASVPYLADCLFQDNVWVIDYARMSRDLGETVDEHSIYYLGDKLGELYDYDWPSKINPNYEYLCRILTEVKKVIDTEHFS